jgi:hypothetical protein
MKIYTTLSDCYNKLFKTLVSNSDENHKKLLKKSHVNKAYIHHCVSVRMFYNISLKTDKMFRFGRREIQDRRPNENTVI